MANKKVFKQKWFIITSILFSGLIVWTIYDYFYHPVHSNEYLLITSNEHNWPEDNIFAISPDGSRIKRVVTGFDPSCSPDGRRIAFAAPVGVSIPLERDWQTGVVTGRRAYTQIFVMDASGFNATQLTFDESYNNSPSWSPDGQYLAFDGFRNVAVINLKSKEITYPIKQELTAMAPSWSPDGQRLIVLAYTAKDHLERGLYIANVDGTNMTRLTSGYDRDPNWSPDGNKIVFLHSETVFDPTSIRVINIDGSNPVDILPPTKNFEIHSPKWSPDGKRIAFREPGDGVFIINADGTGLTNIKPAQKTWGVDGGGIIPLMRSVFYTNIDWCKVR